MRLTFFACQAKGDKTDLINESLITEEEEMCLESCTIGTRPLVVVSWITRHFDSYPKRGMEFSPAYDTQISSNLQSLRGGIGATLGTIGTQLPYPYVHAVYWTVQILLMSLAIETGANLAQNLYFENTGKSMSLSFLTYTHKYI